LNSRFIINKYCSPQTLQIYC